nr:HD domain-containing phosphohydrolase [Brevibacillus sp. JNUCC-41]
MRHHHGYVGLGYPNGLAGGDIPLFGKEFTSRYIFFR